MLVLTRKKNETILIGDNIKITVVATGHTTRIGIDAPRDVRVVRGEIANHYQPGDVPDLDTQEQTL